MTADTFQSGAPGVSVRHLFVLTFLAAALIFTLHHLPPLSDHAIVASTAVFAIVALVATLLGALVARAGTESPIVVIGAPGKPQVREALEDDLDFSAGLHIESLAHGFFTSLGPGFMRAYHRTFLDSPYATALIATTQRHRVGFLVGVLQPEGHAHWVIRHRGPGLALRGAAALAIRPRLAFGFVRSRLGRYAATWRRHSKQEKTDAQKVEAGSTPAVLSHMAVVPGARGSGIGLELVHGFEANAGEAGATSAILTTLPGTAGAGPFYASAGWGCRGDRVGFDKQPTEEWGRALEGEL